MGKNVMSAGDVLVERFMKPHGITQADISKATGIPQSALNQIMSGKRGVSPKNASLLGKALGTSAEYWMDLDSRYQLSKVDEDASEVTVLISDKPEYQPTMWENGGYLFSGINVDDAYLGRAVRGAVFAAGQINPPQRDMVIDSVIKYIMYKTITVPGAEDYIEYPDDLPWDAVGIYGQFLIAVGENPDEVSDEIHHARTSMVANAGKTDADGIEREQNWRSAKNVQLKYVGELMCGASQLEQDDRDEVMGCLFAYTHDETIVLPESIEARRLFNKFLVHCEGYHRVIEALGMTPDEYFNDNSEWSRG